MGSYTFTWEHPAEEVFVTGTFDDWTKSEKLDKVGDIFKKTVEFKDASKKIYYKFVVDHAWIINESSPKEADHEGNVNNFLTPEDMASENSAAPVIGTVTAESTTAQLAGEQPIEKNDQAENKNESKDEKDEKPEAGATPGHLPGGFPLTPSDDQEKLVTINPLPAAAGAVNPIKLEPGEPVPQFSAESINDHVKLDEASYEQSDALPGIETAHLQPPPVSDNMIPESSLPVVDATAAHINTVGDTTLALAADVPLEAKVPEIVKDSQEEAGFDPEASAIPDEVQEKAQLEEELKNKVPEIPAASESAPADTTERDADTTVAAAVIVTGDGHVDNAAPIADEAPDLAAQDVSAQHEGQEKDEKSTEAAAEPIEAQVIAEEIPAPVQAVETQPEEVQRREIEAETTEAVPVLSAIQEVKTEELKAEQVKPEESEAEETAATEVLRTKIEEERAPVVEASEAPAPETTAQVPATEVPESTGATQLEEEATASGSAAERPHLEIPSAESERTEVSPTGEAPSADAQANGSEEKVPSSPSDKKRSRFSAFFSRFRSRLSK